MSTPASPITEVGPAARAPTPARPGPAAPEASASEGRRAARDFEAVLLHKVLKTMEQTIPESELFSGAGSEQVRGMFWRHLADEVAESGGIGLGEQLYRQKLESSSRGDAEALR